MTDIDSLIGRESKHISEVFSEVSLNGAVKRFDFLIDEKKLNSKYLNEINITSQGDFVTLFQQLQEFDDYPALYIFGINPLLEKTEIISLIESSQLNIPARNKILNNTGILYIGKVKKCAWGRLIQHLGYHQQRKSHGLQIDFWANKTSLELKLSYTVIFFNKSMADYIQVLEQALAKSLKPIIGKY